MRCVLHYSCRGLWRQSRATTLRREFLTRCDIEGWRRAVDEAAVSAGGDADIAFATLYRDSMWSTWRSSSL
jgi:hypothetical protein